MGYVGNNVCVKDTFESVYVFGYGSLLWKPDPHMVDASKQIGHIKGYKRRFYQGNTTFRGTEDRIGRVATIIPSEKSQVWGVMFEINGDHKQIVLDELNNREVKNGGYTIEQTLFYPRDYNKNPLLVYVYVASTENEHYLGKENMNAMAMQIFAAVGTAGPNTDYITKLADYIRMHIPEEHDNHLFTLDTLVRKLMAQQSNIEIHDCIKSRHNSIFCQCK